MKEIKIKANVYQGKNFIKMEVNGINNNPTLIGILMDGEVIFYI